MVVYFARKKSCWEGCVAPEEKAVEVIGTSYNGTIDRQFRDRENGGLAEANGEEGEMYTAYTMVQIRVKHRINIAIESFYVP